MRIISVIDIGRWRLSDDRSTAKRFFDILKVGLQVPLEIGATDGLYHQMPTKKKGMVMKNVIIVCMMIAFIWYTGISFCQEQPPLGLPSVPVPQNNVQSPEKIVLGKKLFEDKRFSGDGTISCASCHVPGKGFSDGLPVAEGIKKLKGTRNTPTIINAAYYTSQFWDGRRPNLEEQAKDPFVNLVEHGLGEPQGFHEFIIKIVRNDPDYQEQFRHVFGIKPSAITIDHVAKAIASFERTVISGDSAFDHYMYGGDKAALSESAKRGLGLYKGKARCQECHAISENYAIFTDNKFHNLGVGFKKIQPRLKAIVREFRRAQGEGIKLDETGLTKEEISEVGRFIITGELSDIGAFKTPSLRNIAVTGPYMHDGSLKTLEEVMALYNKGGEKNPFLGSVRVLDLTDEEINDVIEFLKSLTSPKYMNLVKE